MASFWDKLIIENANYCDYHGTVVISNLSEYYDLAIIRDSDKKILLGSEQGNYAGGISVWPEMDLPPFYVAQFPDYTYSNRLKSNLKHYKYSEDKELVDFYNNILKVAYSYNKDLFDSI